MHPRTNATLEELRQAEWFKNVGVKDTAAAEVLSSWREAAESCASPDWRNLCLEAMNQYNARIRERSMERLRQWNDLVIEIRPVTKALVQDKMRVLAGLSDVGPSVRSSIEWDILMVCMEAEYADVYPPGFFASQSYWYVKGHFPCGWRGDFPAGKLIIY